MPRVYERLFDYEEARLRRANGESVANLADEYGVTKNAIYRATTPGRIAWEVEYHRRWRITVCSVCGGPATKRHGFEPRCIDCFAIANSVTVGDGELRCNTCHEWKPDSAYPWNSAGPKHRRGRHQTCRTCHTELKRRQRERLKVPCVRCGKPRLPKSEIGGSHPDTGLCLTCYRQRGRAAA